MNVDHFKKKQRLFQEWVGRLPSNSKVTPAFDQSFSLTIDSADLLRRVQASELEALYMLLLNVGNNLVPGYIGKSHVPYNRWNTGHLQALREGRKSYQRWHELIQENGVDAFTLICVNQDSILFPPYPGFPTQVGRVEYQLVGLATAVYQETLLNREGAAR